MFERGGRGVQKKRERKQKKRERKQKKRGKRRWRKCISLRRFTHL
jgi:hypothetical protein